MPAVSDATLLGETGWPARATGGTESQGSGVGLGVGVGVGTGVGVGVGVGSGSGGAVGMGAGVGTGVVAGFGSGCGSLPVLGEGHGAGAGVGWPVTGRSGGAGGGAGSGVAVSGVDAAGVGMAPGFEDGDCGRVALPSERLVPGGKLTIGGGSGVGVGVGRSVVRVYAWIGLEFATRSVAPEPGRTILPGPPLASAMPAQKPPTATMVATAAMTGRLTQNGVVADSVRSLGVACRDWPV